MKEFSVDAKMQVENKLRKMQAYLDTYNKLESEIGNNLDLKYKETLDKIPILRAHKANEVYSIVKKYGWLGKNDISENAYQTMFNCLLYGDLNTLLLIYPYLKKALLLGKITEEEFNMVLDRINSLEIDKNNTEKGGLKALK